MKFTKMHGIGNDYVYINTFEEQVYCPSRLAVQVSDRHFGIGSDGLVLIGPPSPEHAGVAHATMRMFNSDGTESAMCGNAIRCVGKYVYDTGMVRERFINIETGSGIKQLELFLDDNPDPAQRKVHRVCVDMGEPVLLSACLPPVPGDELSQANETAPFIKRPLLVGGVQYFVTTVDMGNPHAVIFLDPQRDVDLDSLDIDTLGPLFEKHPLFPQRTNTEFVDVLDESRVRMRVWERGAGETLACGTGACAVTVAGVLCGLTGRHLTVELPGGELDIEWRKSNNHVFMTGDACTVFSGDIQGVYNGPC